MDVPNLIFLQDAHELLRHLMDGLRSEEVRRQRTAILKHFGLTEKTDPKKVRGKILGVNFKCRKFQGSAPWRGSGFHFTNFGFSPNLNSKVT